MNCSSSDQNIVDSRFFDNSNLSKDGDLIEVNNSIIEKDKSKSKIYSNSSKVIKDKNNNFPLKQKKNQNALNKDSIAEDIIYENTNLEFLKMMDDEKREREEREKKGMDPEKNGMKEFYKQFDKEQLIDFITENELSKSNTNNMKTIPNDTEACELLFNISESKPKLSKSQIDDKASSAKKSHKSVSRNSYNLNTQQSIAISNIKENLNPTPKSKQTHENVPKTKKVIENKINTSNLSFGGNKEEPSFMQKSISDVNRSETDREIVMGQFGIKPNSKSAKEVTEKVNPKE